DLFAAFIRAPWGQQARDREGHTQELLTGHLALGTQTAGQASTLVVVSLTSLVLIVSALALNARASLAVLEVSVRLSLLLRPLSTLGAHYGRARSRESMHYAGGAQEAVRLAEENHIFGADAAQCERLGGLLQDLRRPVFRTQLLARFIPGLYQSLIYLL